MSKASRIVMTDRQMAFRQFQTGSHGDDTSLPWTEEYLKTNPQDIKSVHDVVTVRLTTKGMMISTSVSKSFIYKSHVSYNHMIEFLDAWSGKKMSSPLLQVQLISIRPFINLGTDDIRQGVWSPKSDESWRQAYATTRDNPMSPSNPLPLPKSSGVSVLSDDSAQEIVDCQDIKLQTSQDLPLEEAASGVNGHKGRNTRKKN